MALICAGARSCEPTCRGDGILVLRRAPSTRASRPKPPTRYSSKALRHCETDLSRVDAASLVCLGLSSNSIIEFDLSSEQTSIVTTNHFGKVASLDTHPDHADKCNVGGGTIRMHKASLVQLVGSFCREAGLDTRLESVVPEFMRGKP